MSDHNELKLLSALEGNFFSYHGSPLTNLREQRKIAKPKSQAKNTRLGHAFEVVSELTGIPVSEIKGKTSNKKVFFARHLLCFLARYNTVMSLPAIGRVLKRHHTTIMHSIRIVEYTQFERYEKFVDAAQDLLDQRLDHN